MNLTADILPLWLASVSLACVGLVGLWGLSVGGHPALEFHLLGLSAMVLLPEGFMNGAIMTLLIALKPEWVRSFDDHDYIDGK